MPSYPGLGRRSNARSYRGALVAGGRPDGGKTRRNRDAEAHFGARSEALAAGGRVGGKMPD
ncbi:MAG: hypothetical protein HYV63_31835 [Candidatus Schekmanbacteria bacterium]|nr:hypothetical protein [Candidatus Schekmanbacteria bacterium]